MSKYLTKKEALRLFNSAVKPGIPKNDKPALSLEWNMFTDQLNRDGQISDNQRMNWDNPFYK